MDEKIIFDKCVDDVSETGGEPLVDGTHKLGNHTLLNGGHLNYTIFSYSIFYYLTGLYNFFFFCFLLLVALFILFNLC